MYRRFGLIYTIFSVLVLTVLIVLVLARLNTARALNIEEAEASFTRLARELTDEIPPGGSASSTEDARVPALPDVIRDYTALVPAVDAVILFNPERGVRYATSRDAGLLAISRSGLDDFTGFPEYRQSEISQYRLRRPLDRGDLYLDAVYTVLTFSDAYLPLRDSLISLLVFAFLTVLLVLALGRSRGADANDADPRRPRSDTMAPGSAAGPGPAPGPSTQSSRTEPTPKPARSDAPETHEPARAGDPRLDPASGDFDYQEISLEELSTDPGEPGTLFNPISGLSHRQHLERRLGLELERSAYNDQDLTCIIVSFPHISGDEQYVDKAKQVLATFQFEDLCFEYGDSSFCVILPNTELPQGIRQAESFRKRHPDALLGLSARNGRLVEAHRVLTEADRSLSHAAQEPGGVVGFRPDPRKYRQFVTRQFEHE